MPAEELEIIAAERAARVKENNNRKSINYRMRERTKDEVAYKRRVTESKLAWSDKNRDRVNQIAAGVRGRNLASKRFWCDVCELPFQSQVALESHYKTEAHINAVDGIKKAPAQPDAARLKANRDRIRESAVYICKPCNNKVFDNLSALTRHKEGKRHCKKLGIPWPVKRSAAQGTIAAAFASTKAAAAQDAAALAPAAGPATS